jgi:hypothetical protein
MKITIECHCGQSYEAEFEPVAGRAPNPIVCPGCGTEATESVNATLRPRPQLRKAEPVEPVPSPTPPVVAEAAVEVPAHCFRHTDKPVAMFCFLCKKPMCGECMELYGLVCSPYCRQQAKAQGLEIPE